MGARGTVKRALDSWSEGLGFNSQCWPCVEVLGKLPILHCLGPPSRNGYLVHSYKVGSIVAGCIGAHLAREKVKSVEHALPWSLWNHSGAEVLNRLAAVHRIQASKVSSSPFIYMFYKDYLSLIDIKAHFRNLSSVTKLLLLYKEREHSHSQCRTNLLMLSQYWFCSPNVFMKLMESTWKHWFIRREIPKMIMGSISLNVSFFGLHYNGTLIASLNIITTGCFDKLCF